MARSKQTARKSTGGKNPRKQLAAKAKSIKKKHKKAKKAKILHPVCGSNQESKEFKKVLRYCDDLPLNERPSPLWENVRAVVDGSHQCFSEPNASSREDTIISTFMHAISQLADAAQVAKYAAKALSKGSDEAKARFWPKAQGVMDQLSDEHFRNGHAPDNESVQDANREEAESAKDGDETSDS